MSISFLLSPSSISLVSYTGRQELCLALSSRLTFGKLLLLNCNCHRLLVGHELQDLHMVLQSLAFYYTKSDHFECRCICYAPHRSVGYRCFYSSMVDSTHSRTIYSRYRSNINDNSLSTVSHDARAADILASGILCCFVFGIFSGLCLHSSPNRCQQLST